jgi:uncharacterized protein (DUF1778 family)
MSRKNNNRTINISFKVDPATEKVIRDAANNAEMFVSEYIRMAVINQAKSDQLKRELKKSSTNDNG